MSGKIVINPINKGIRTDRTAFNIDNDAFPVLVNAYQWRGRIKRKRGTSLLNRLTRYFASLSSAYSSTTTITLDGSGNGNLITGFSLQTNASIVPGSVTITAPGPTVYTDPAMNGTLSPSGTINYATGAITIAAAAGLAVSVILRYYPDLPVMGLEEDTVNTGQFPGTLGFDTTYAYNITTTYPYNIYSVSFYKNPVASSPYNYPGYVRKAVDTPTTWNGQTYQQFWSTNYEGAFWITNGINVPFSAANVGMQYKPIVTTTVIAGGPPATVNLQITAHGLIVGDFVFINEVVTTTGINFQTGYVITVTDANNVIVEFPNATIATNGTGGIAQYLTNRADVTKDSLRWYDGDPTDGSATSPVLNTSLGWVNFAPPISQSAFSIADQVAAQYYLVGARMIVPFKDRLLFFGPVIQTSVPGSQRYLQDTIIYSQNGTPYYTCSFTGDVDSSATVFNPILTPLNSTTGTVQTATATAFFADQTGFGGFISLGLNEPITTVSTNEDVLIVGFSRIQTRLVYTGNDVVPFNLYIINSELGSDSTFSTVNLDRGVISVGGHGITITSQVSAQRIDLEIPDQIFQFNLNNNGIQRVCSQRDFINEWIYFTYLDNESAYTYPNQTLQYNYRDNSWAIFNESYTTYGTFRKATGQTWQTLAPDLTWASWNDPWNAGSSTLRQPEVIGGNQQGFVLIREGETNEGTSLYIQGFSGSTVTSPSHGLNNGDYIVISGCLGTISSVVNGNIYKVATATTNTFVLSPPIGSRTYLGSGVITRMYIPFIQTKQFPMAWDMGRKTRIGVQQYLLTTTAKGQIELQIYLSQNDQAPYNFGPIIPAVNVENDSLVYSDILYTCPESTNLGLTPANTNLQMPTAASQSQTWHRMNTSLIGDTVQLGFTMSEDQMRDIEFNNQFAEIELHSIILTITPSQQLA